MNNRNIFLIVMVLIIISYSALASAVVTVYTCGQSISAPGQYILNQSINSSATCLTINSSNVELDCAGKTINYGTAGTASSFGINAIHASISQTNLTIKNCIIVKPVSVGASGRGISLTRFANSTILNNTIMTNGTSSNVGIYIITGSDGNNLSKNTIITSGTSSTNHGISLNAGTTNSIVENNIITTGKGTSTTDNYGVYATDPKAKINNNIISTFGSGDSNYGIYSSASANTFLVNNTIYTSGNNGNNRAIFLYASDFNYIANNTLNASGQASTGIYISSSNSVNIINNNINSTADAIYITSATMADYTTANISRDNTRYGRNITVYGGGSLTLPCPNNTILNNPSDGALKFIGCFNITIKNWHRPNKDTDGLLFVNSDNNKIINNTINGGIDGIDMVNAAGTCDGNIIENNTFSSYGYVDAYAIHVYGNYNLISGNNLSTEGITSGNNGIDIRNDFNNITNNIVNTGGTSGNKGINLESGAQNNLIQGNKITTSGTSGNTGIYLVSTNTGNTIINNSITATGSTSGNLGIRLVTNSNYNLIENNSFITTGLTSGNNGIDLSSSSNNLFKSNIVYAGLGGGTTDNDAISIISSRNNSFVNNILFANGTASSLTSSSIFLQSNSANNTFSNNKVIKSVGNAIELDFSGTYPAGNIFFNNSLINVSGADLQFMDPNINGTTLINQHISRYNFSGIGENMIIEDLRFGKISFLQLINGSGNNLSNDIRLGYNFSYITTGQRGLNSTANVSLYGLDTNYVFPIVLRDNLNECNSTTSPACINLTSLNAGNITFSVNGPGNYSIADIGDKTPPLVIIFSPENRTYGNNFVLINFSASDTNGINSCYQYLDGDLIGQDCLSFTISGLLDGKHNLTLRINDSVGNMQIANVSFIIDNSAPVSSNIITTNPTSYLPNNFTYFNVSWTDPSLDSIWFESNLSGKDGNYSMQLLSNGRYSSKYILPSGSFYWKGYANDSFGHVGSTSKQTFTIQKSNQGLALYINGLESNIEITYGEESNATFFSADSSGQLLRNNDLVSNGDIKIFAAGYYNYTAIFEGNQNYSSKITTLYLNVTKAIPDLELLLNDYDGPKTINAFQTLFINSSSLAPLEHSVNLYEDDVLFESGIDIEVNTEYSNIGSHIWRVEIDESENYTSWNKSQNVIVVDQNAPHLINIYPNQQFKSSNYLNGAIYEFNSSWTDDVGVEEVIFEFNGANYSYMNGDIINEGQDYRININDLPAGSYRYQWYAKDSSGNMVPSGIQIYNVTKKPTSLKIKISDNNPTYGSNTSISCITNNPETLPELKRNSLDIQNPDTGLLGVDIYKYVCESESTENYTSAITGESFVNVIKASPNMSLILNNQSSNIILPIGGGQINISAGISLLLGINAEITLFVDDTVVRTANNSIIYNVSFVGGTHNISLSYQGNDNYTSRMIIGLVSVQTPVSNPPSNGGGSGGGGGGGGRLTIINNSVQTTIALDVENLGDLIISPGESKTLSVNVKNIGGIFLNKCKLKPKEGYQEWFTTKETKNLNPGEISEFIFSVNAPINSSTEFRPGLEIACIEKSFDVPMKIIILQSGMNVEVKNINLIDDGNVEINYTLIGNSEFKQDIIIKVFNSNDELITSKDETLDVELGKKEKSTRINIKDADKGLLKISLFKKGDNDPIVEEFFVYDSSRPITGLALFNSTNKTSIYVIIIILLFLVGAFFVIKRIRTMDKWDKVHTKPKIREKVKAPKVKSVKQIAIEHSKEVHPQKIELLDIRDEEEPEQIGQNNKIKTYKEDRDGFLDLTK